MAIGGTSARWPARRANMVPMSSTVTVQPSSSHRTLNQSRTSRSSSVSVNRQMPPFGVAPIRALSIRSFHSRSGSIVRFFISDFGFAGFHFGKLGAPIFALEHEGHCGHPQQGDADDQ